MTESAPEPKPARLVVFAGHPVQYQVPLYRELARRRDLSTLVFFGSRHGVDAAFDKGFGTKFQWDIPLLDGYEHEFLENAAPAADVERFRGVRLNDPRAILRRARPDACLVMGWQTLAHVQIMRAAFALGIPVIVRGESNLQRRPLPGLRARLRAALWLPVRERLYRAAFRRVRAFAVIGSLNAAFYRHFGVPEEKLLWAPYGVANEHFALRGPERDAARQRLRGALGCAPASVVFVSVAKLVPFKRPLDLLDAFATVVERGVDARLVYVGDGPLRGEVEREATRRGLGSRVSVTGFVNQSAIPEWYAAADALVLPSDYLETWGLAVNEAMAAGLPVIVSTGAGCAADLVREGENGFTFPVGDRGRLAELMSRLAAAGPAGRAAMGERSREIVAGFTIPGAARAIGDAAVALAGARQLPLSRTG